MSRLYFERYPTDSEMLYLYLKLERSVWDINKLLEMNSFSPDNKYHYFEVDSLEDLSPWAFEMTMIGILKWKESGNDKEY